MNTTLNPISLKKIRILNVQFDTEIKAYEIPAFRGAIIKKVGQENVLFHNHLNDSQFLYRYPQIQYKQINRKPTIVCIDYGVDEIHKFFEQRDWSLNISGRTLDMKISDLRLNEFTMQVWDKKWNYSIINWIALNQENYKKYMQIESLAEKIEQLENLLIANIMSFAKGIQWTIEKPVELKIKEIKRTKPVKLKQKRVLAFDVDFNTNVFLPNYIGLGKSVSLGFGTVRQNKN